ncbi:intracellular short-chain-length polyhydroxyalkanoate depolymerase [Clostridium sp. JNZ J1-5]
MGKEILLKSIKISNGETLGYRESGSGNKILVFVHGNMTSSKHWDVLIEALPENYKIYALDLRGFGISTYNNPIDSINDFSEDLKLFVDKLHLKNFYLAGWSTGGAVSMQFTANYPDYVKKLILIESIGVKGYDIYQIDENGKILKGKRHQSKESLSKDYIHVTPSLEAFINKDRAYFKNLWNALIYTSIKPCDEKYEEYLDDILTQRNQLDVYWALLKFNISNEHNGVTDGSNDVDKITAPTLIFQGERDLVVPPIQAVGIKEGIGENALLVKLPSGHSPLIDCLDLLVENIISFIEK